MKRLFLILFLLLAGTGWGQWRDRYAGPLTADKVKYVNAVSITPAQNLANEYASLCARGDMGTASATNRRVLLLTPGIYTLAATLTLNTDYVDVAGLGGAPEDTVVVGVTGGPTVNQTCADLRLQGFTIRHSGTSDSPGDHAFMQSNADNSASYYRLMYFDQTNALQTVVTSMRASIWGVEDLAGTWEYCRGSGYAWRVIASKKISGTFRYCIGGYGSFAADTDSAEVSGTFLNCVGGAASFGGCAQFGCLTSGTFEYCTAGDNSYGMGREFSGTARWCKGGSNCFGGYDPDQAGSYYGVFSGVAENCVINGGQSFGMGHASCVQSGIIINCRAEDPSWYAEGANSSRLGTITDNGAAATLTVAIAGANNDVTYTATRQGTMGNRIQIDYDFVGPGTGIDVGIVQGAGLVVITLSFHATNAKTANAAVAALAGNAEASSYVTGVAEGDGTGLVTATTPAYLTGGVNSPWWEGNASQHPIALTADTSIAPFDNGATFTNTGASGTVKATLPAAKVGLKYKFMVTAAQILQIDPSGTETLAKTTGYAQIAAGELIYQNTAGYFIELECIVAGSWVCTGSNAAWTEETP